MASMAQQAQTLHQLPYRIVPEHQQFKQNLLPNVRSVLQTLLDQPICEEESAQAVTDFVYERFMETDPDMIYASGPQLAGQILEGVAHWVRRKQFELDGMVPNLQAGQGVLIERSRSWKVRMEEQVFRVYQEPYRAQVVVEMLHALVVGLLGREALCLAYMLASTCAHQLYDPTTFSLAFEWPATLLAFMVRKLQELQAKTCKVVMELYKEAGYLNHQYEPKERFMVFFQYYTVDPQQYIQQWSPAGGLFQMHATPNEATFRESQFRISLIDSFGGLMQLLSHLEGVCRPANGHQNGHEAILAVDFEGVKLCRHGALCLVQLTCSDDPALVYVLDVYVLGKRIFTMETPRGTSMKNLLEAPDIRKVWFDPRNDVDALYHQFGIAPQGIFDLQLAEVMERRNRGLNAHFVLGLQKCLAQCPELQQSQKNFAEQINQVGKGLYEPNNGGHYEVFQRRPLNPLILIYAAHDSRYMLTLYRQSVQALNQMMIQRVLIGSEIRGRWWQTEAYNVPSSEAPDF